MELSALAQLYLVSCISKVITGNFNWNNKLGWVKVKEQIISLPTKNNDIDISFMEAYITELEIERLMELQAYLSQKA